MRHSEPGPDINLSDDAKATKLIRTLSPNNGRPFTVLEV